MECDSEIWKYQDEDEISQRDHSTKNQKEATRHGEELKNINVTFKISEEVKSEAKVNTKCINEKTIQTENMLGTDVCTVKEECPNKHKNMKLRIKLPGQSQEGELPSSSLTLREFTKIKKTQISAQKFPCFIKRSQIKEKNKVTSN